MAVGIAGFALGDGTDGGGEPGPLAWRAEPRVVVPERLPSDRILTGRVRNDSLERVRIRAGDVAPVDAEGREVQGTATFAESFLHGLHPPTREPPRLPESELRRTGRLAVIEPGRTARLTVSWRIEGGRRPVRVDYGQGSLPIP